MLYYQYQKETEKNMINNQWYAVLSSREVKKNKIVGVKRFGENLVFYRDQNGHVACLHDQCIHRGASLAKGELIDGCIACPFHGIRYAADGSCTLIPSEGHASTINHDRFHMKSYPAKEIGDIIFVWYGDKAPDKDPDYFDVITDSSFSYRQMNDNWGVDYSRVIENQLDVSHLAFVHRTTIGRGNKTLCHGPKVEWLDDNTLRTSANNEVDTGQAPKPAEDSVIKNTNLTFKFPNMWLNHVSDKIMILAYFVPVDDEHSIISLRFYNKITGFKPVDKFIALFGNPANRIVERQDKRIVETQIPKKSTLYGKENLVAADLPIMEYRSKREELKSR